MNTLKQYKIHLKGISPLIMHSDRIANPLDPMKKKISELTSIKKKMDEHHIAIARLSWEAAFYFHDELGIYIPSKVIGGCFKSAAKKFKLGKQTKAIMIDAPVGTPLLGYEKKTPAIMWEIKDKDGGQLHVFAESVVRNNSRVMCYRPIFQKWDIKFGLYLNTELLSEKQLRDIIQTAGYEFGFCELRPERASGTYGRFELVSMEEV